MRFSGKSGAWARLYRSGAALFWAAIFLCCTGCGGGGGGSAPVSAPASRALVVGDAAGAVLQAIQSSFQVVPGTGSEDPAAYALIIFDGDHTDPATLRANPGVRSFLDAGKPLVILNETAAHLGSLSDLVWASAMPLGTSPAVAFFVRRNQGGVPQELVQVDFPDRLEGAAPGQDPPTPAPTDSQLADDSATWLAQLSQMLAVSGNVAPANIGGGQAVLSFDHVKAVHITDETILAWATSQSGGPPQSTTWGVNNSTPPNFSVDLTGAFETRVYAMLEGTSPSTYQHKIFARQYLLVSPSIQDFGVLQYPIVGSSPLWNFPETARTVMGWNSGFELITQLQPGNGVPANAIAVTRNLPESQNGVVSLTTSESHTESVSVSVTGGVQNETGVGTVSASWSDSWTWGQAQSVSFQDWAAQSCIGFYDPDSATCNTINDLDASNYFAAFAGSDLTDAILRSPSNVLSIPWNNNQLNNLSPVIYSPSPNLNALQSSAMTNQTETTWETTNTGGGAVNLLPPQTVTLNSIARVFTGEMENVYGSQGPFINPFGQFWENNGFTSWLRADENVSIALNFGAPGLQPPGWNAKQQTSVLAPWTLSFGEWSQKSGHPYAHVTGTLTLDKPSATPTNILLTYVIQPQSQIVTMPAGQPNACPANTTSFVPGNVFPNQKPPLQITIPANQTSVTFPLTFQTFNDETYNVQVVAWQTQTTVDGETIINPQSAWCLTPPNTLP